MHGKLWIVVYFFAGWFLLLVWVYQNLGATAQARDSVEFLLVLGAVLVGALAFVVGVAVAALHSTDLEGSGDLLPVDRPGKPKWDEEYDTGSTGDELEDLGLVKPQAPLPSDPRRRAP